jgi:hypothetical protein
LEPPVEEVRHLDEAAQVCRRVWCAAAAEQLGAVLGAGLRVGSEVGGGDVDGDGEMVPGSVEVPRERARRRVAGLPLRRVGDAEHAGAGPCLGDGVQQQCNGVAGLWWGAGGVRGDAGGQVQAGVEAGPEQASRVGDGDRVAGG